MSNGVSVDTSSASDDDTISSTPGFRNMQVYGLQPENWKQNCLSIVVVGASGDLAKKKIYPALFALYYEGMLPEHFYIYGFSRTAFSDEDFADTIMGSLTCRLDHAYVEFVCCMLTCT